MAKQDPAVVAYLIAAFARRYYYTDPIHLVNEVDGVRIISIDKCEFLQKVPRESRPMRAVYMRPSSI